MVSEFWNSIWEVFAVLLHSPSKKEIGLPAHQLLSQPLEWNATETFCEHVAKLVLGVDLLESYLTIRIMDFLAKPVIFDGIVFGAKCHTARFKITEDEGTNVIFMDLMCMLAVSETLIPRLPPSS